MQNARPSPSLLSHQETTSADTQERIMGHRINEMPFQIKPDRIVEETAGGEEFFAKKTVIGCYNWTTFYMHKPKHS